MLRRRLRRSRHRDVILNISTYHRPRYPSKAKYAQLLIGFCCRRRTHGVEELTGLLRVDAKTDEAGKEFGPRDLVLQSELPLCHGKRPPRSTKQRLAGPVVP
jgi:hypothetical protein